MYNEKTYDDLNVINLTDNAINGGFFSGIAEIILYYSNYLFDNKNVEGKFSGFSASNFVRISTDNRISAIHLDEIHYHKIRNILDPIIDSLKKDTSPLNISNIIYDAERDLKLLYSDIQEFGLSKVNIVDLFVGLFKVGFMNMYLNKYINHNKEYENIKKHTMDRIKLMYLYIIVEMNSLEKIKLQVRTGKYNNKFYSFSIHTVYNKGYYEYNIHIANEEDNKQAILDVIKSYYPNSYNKFIKKLAEQGFNNHRKESEMDKYFKMLY